VKERLIHRFRGENMDPKSATTTVLLVDDHALIRQQLRGALEQHRDVQVIGEASSGVEAVQYARTLQPDVVVMDLSMPAMDGVKATRLIREEHPRITVIGLSVFETAMVRDALINAGASGLLMKEHAAEDLYSTIQRYRRESP
jgi:DNA-binding NarL/FixJ family response regulator